MTVGFQAYEWQGETILDIHKWCEERNEKMIKYEAIKNMPNIFTGKMYTKKRIGEMPETFWRTLRMVDGWVYKEIK